MLEGQPRSSNHRASLAVLVGLGAAAAVPAAIGVAQQLPSVTLLQAAWGIPVAIALALLSFGLANLARVRVQWTLGRAGGDGRTRLARRLATLGICFAASGTIAVVFYEILLRLEK